MPASNLHTPISQDHTLYAVSAWNDNGKAKHVHDPKVLYRTDFFPGLGWMTSRRVWEELSAKWTSMWRFANPPLCTPHAPPLPLR